MRVHQCSSSTNLAWNGKPFARNFPSTQPVVRWFHLLNELIKRLCRHYRVLIAMYAFIDTLTVINLHTQCSSIRCIYRCLLLPPPCNRECLHSHPLVVIIIRLFIMARNLIGCSRMEWVVTFNYDHNSKLNNIWDPSCVWSSLFWMARYGGP